MQARRGAGETGRGREGAKEREIVATTLQVRPTTLARPLTRALVDGAERSSMGRRLRLGKGRHW